MVSSGPTVSNPPSKLSDATPITPTIPPPNMETQETTTTTKKSDANNSSNNGGNKDKDNNSKSETISQPATTSTAPSTTNPSSTTTDNINGGNGSATAPASSTTPSSPSNNPPPTPAPAPTPLLKGTLSYNIDPSRNIREHRIRGNWSFENNNELPSQRFELKRSLSPDDDPTDLPRDGEFHGSFSMINFYTTSKGKKKERSQVINETGVKIEFSFKDEGVYEVKGRGTNQFGVFEIHGTATKSPHDNDPSYDVELRKTYPPNPEGTTTTSVDDPEKKKKKSKGLKRKHDFNLDDASHVSDSDPLPPPTPSYPRNVVCLRGSLTRSTSTDGVPQLTHTISGMWSSGLDLLQDDPTNAKGLCNPFEYQHRCTVPTDTFPITGRYTGWFLLSQDDGSKTRVTEKDLHLKFRKNAEGYWNVEGRGSNGFGRYNITGTMTTEYSLTIFRHFQPRKTPSSKDKKQRQHNEPPMEGPVLRLNDVPLPSGHPLPPHPPPPSGNYTAISRGVFRINSDGAHTCSGKWAITREHYNTGHTSNFHFGLEAHHALNAAKDMEGVESEEGEELEERFPVDSAQYKGSFKMRRGGAKYTSVVDRQIVLKFRKNAAGSFNVYGRGINNLGTFTLVGTFIPTSQGSGQVELYRVYPPGDGEEGKMVENSNSSSPVVKKLPLSGGSGTTTPGGKHPRSVVPKNLPTPKMAKEALSSDEDSPSKQAQLANLQRSSSRVSKPPTHLSEDDPKALHHRILDKCHSLLRTIREKDLASGSYFAEPVDPVALGIPTYNQVISNPMDLGTIQSKLDAKEIDNHEDFSRLVRLVFQNAMTFNVDSTHAVHIAARNLLNLFNQKFKEVEKDGERLAELKKTKVVKTKEERILQKKKDREMAKEAKRKAKEEMRLARKKQRLERERESKASQKKKEETTSTNATTTTTPQAPEGFVNRKDFDALKQEMESLKQTLVLFQKQLANQGVTIDLPTPSPPQPPPKPTPTPPPKDPTPTPKPHPKKKKKVPPPKPQPPPQPVVSEEKPLSLKEQEVLTDAINNISNDKLPMVIQIIRESTKLTGDEEEIDLEIDQLDTATQRKLQRFVMKNVKKPPKPKASKPLKKKPPPAPSPTKSPSPPPAPPKKKSPPKEKEKKEKAKPSRESFMPFDHSSSPSSTSSDSSTSPPPPPPSSQPPKDDDNNNNNNNKSPPPSPNNKSRSPSPSTNWGTILPPPASSPSSSDSDSDHDWGAARTHAAAQKSLDLDRKRRDHLQALQHEEMKAKTLREAQSQGERLKLERQAQKDKEEEERRKKERMKEEERREAREAVRSMAMGVEKTIDLDEQRMVMKEIEKGMMDVEGGASPSSDFGF